MATSEIDTAGEGGKQLNWRTRPKKHHVDPVWLRREYHEKQRQVGAVAAEIGCTVEHLNWLVKKFGIPRRDGRAGAIHHTRRSPFDLSRAVWLYEIERKACNDIGIELGVHGCTVRRRLREAGIRIRHHNETKRGAKAKSRTRINEQAVVKLYYEPGQSIKTVAQHYGVERGVIARILHERNAPMKPLSEVRETPTGEAHPSWRPDLSPEERAMRRDGNRQNEWRMKVYERDGFACQRCGDDKGGNLHAHHIEAHNENKELRWVVSNGATLCVSCHREFHRRYGMRGFGRIELDQFRGAA